MVPDRDMLLQEDVLAFSPPSTGGPALNRNSREYVRWVQQTLNRLMGAGLVEDGLMGPRTRQAVQAFQRRAGLKLDGIVGPRTEAALRAAGSTSPATPTPSPVPTPSPGAPTLATLDAFARQFVQGYINQGVRIDCADLAIAIWISFGERYSLPVAFEFWDSDNRRWLVARRDGVRARNSTRLLRTFRNADDYIRYVQVNVGARGLIENTDPVAGGHRAAVAGDVFLWEYVNNQTNVKSSIGHTQILMQVTRSTGGPTSDQIQIAQGTLPPAVPVYRTYPASFFYQNRQATIGGQPHTGVPVGPGPRRFKSFRSLR